MQLVLLQVMPGESVFQRKWTKSIIDCFDYANPEVVISYTDIKNKIWKKSRGKDKLIDDRALTEILNELVSIGFLKKFNAKRKRGYALSQDEHLGYIFKIQDESAIKDCNYKSIHTRFLPFQQKGGKEAYARYLTIYGEKNNNIHDIIFNKTSELYDFYIQKQREAFEEILKKESKNCNKKIKNCLNEWGRWKIEESGLLHPQRGYEVNPKAYGPETFPKIARKYNLTEKEMSKAEEKAKKVMEKLERIFPQTTIVMRF